MSIDNYTHDEQIMTIDKIEFGILGNMEVKEMSVIKEEYGITKPESYTNFEPVVGGLIDKRLGITESHLECATCGHGVNKCPGHFGHIKLAEPVYHFGYISYIKKILSCICIRCSKLLIWKNENKIKKILKYTSGKVRFDEIRKICSSVTYCQKTNYGCGARVPNIKAKTTKNEIGLIAETVLTTLATDEETGNIQENKKKIQQEITAELCYNILKNISDEDCMLMGMDPKRSRPENMILKYLPVPPVQIRPSTRLDFLSSSGEDDLTHVLIEIINSNLRVLKHKEKNGIDNNHSIYGNPYYHLLQYQIATLFNNESSTLSTNNQRNGRPIKSLSARIKSKGGRIRNNLMGKRVNFCSRTVITADPNLEINELGVPLKIAMNITFPEIVTPQNIELRFNKTGKLIESKEIPCRKVGRHRRIRFGDLMEYKQKTDSQDRYESAYAACCARECCGGW